MSALVTGPLATIPSYSHHSWWTGTNPSRSGQLRGGQGDKTGVAAVRERFWIAKHPLLTHLPVQAQPQSLIPWEWGVLGTPRAFYPGGEQRAEIGGWSEGANGRGGAARSWWAEPPAQHMGQFSHDLPQTAPSCCTRLSPPEPCEPRSWCVARRGDLLVNPFGNGQYKR